jgi:hypothetical protein
MDARRRKPRPAASNRRSLHCLRRPLTAHGGKTQSSTTTLAASSRCKVSSSIHPPSTPQTLFELLIKSGRTEPTTRLGVEDVRYAINSARIGNLERAIYHLTAYDYWKFDDAGFAIRDGDGETSPPFMPGNAGFLYAVAYCAAGWKGSNIDAPGFSWHDGTWTVKHKGR